MMPNPNIYFYFCILLALVGCSSVTPVDSVDESTSQNVERGEPESRRAPVSLNRDQVPVETEAVKYLLDIAEQALRIGDVSRAQALADRTLRIDRRVARAYLVSALVQQVQGESNRAADLARQGLLYTPEDSPLGRRLSDLLGSQEI